MGVNLDRMRAAQQKAKETKAVKESLVPDAPARPSRSPDAKDQRLIAKGRLPHGAIFNAVYDASAAKWVGSLAIPGWPMLVAEASGVFALLEKLDNLYRQATEGK